MRGHQNNYDSPSEEQEYQQQLLDDPTDSVSGLFVGVQTENRVKTTQEAVK